MGRTSVCEKTGVRKGSWSPEEDKVLKTYITNNGHGNWNELPKLTGLLRCGESCRFRWKNYLDPILNRGNLTKEEVDFIIEMHKLGYRWSKIASHLKGRTDNDIKNFYYTKLKKKDNDNDTPDRKRPKPAGNDITIGEIQSSSIPILESYSMLPIPPQISGSSPSQPISSQTSSHSPSSIDRSTNENHILKEPERDIIINLSDSECPRDIIICLSDSECPHIEEPERETLIQIYNRLWEEGLSKDPHIPVPPSEEAEEQTYPWDCDVNRSSSIDVSPLHFGSNLSRPNSSQSLSHSSSSSMDKSKNKKIYERVWEEGLSEDPHIPVPVFEQQTYPWTSVYSVCHLEIDSSSSTEESENESSIPEETERGSLKQVYECVRTAVMWVRSLFGFNKTNCS